jgi:hypothetical protein
VTIAPIRQFALSLPEVTEQPHHHYSSFRVRGRIFVTAPPEETHIHVFVDEEDREQALVLHADFLEKLSWGGKVVGLRIVLARADKDVVTDLIRRAWRRKAPKSLHARIGEAGR